jgi:S-DNA-T family DNA segregation ATPase FtsK/SpoIIIE
MEAADCRFIDEYNALNKKESMPKIVVVIDEFADLILSGGSERRVTEVVDGFGPRGGIITHQDEKPSIEAQIVRLAQKARAVGIHLILATQRPSADVVTGLLKANFATKMAFMTSTAVNSRIIIDQDGAEELTGKGDMLFLDPSKNSLERLQGLYA